MRKLLLASLCCLSMGSVYAHAEDTQKTSFQDYTSTCKDFLADIAEETKVDHKGKSIYQDMETQSFTYDMGKIQGFLSAYNMLNGKVSGYDINFYKMIETSCKKHADYRLSNAIMDALSMQNLVN